MVSYKKLWQSTKKELDDLKSRMIKQTLTVVSIATSKEPFGEVSDISYEFYRETKIYTISFEEFGEKEISIIGPEGVIGKAEDWLKNKGYIVKEADLVVLRKRES